MKMTSKVKTTPQKGGRPQYWGHLKNEDDLKIVKDNTALPYTAVAVIFWYIIAHVDIQY